MRTRLKVLAASTALAALASMPASASGVTFSTFVTGADLNAVLGQNNTIAFNYAGDKFVGSVYSGSNNLQLYSTDLNGQNVQKFGNPLPSGGGEVVVGAGLGLGGFQAGAIFAGSGSNIYQFAPTGGAPSLFASLPDSGTARYILMDPGNTFGGNMLVSTDRGNIYKFSSGGTASLLASIGADTEGMDIASANFGQYAGSLIVASEGLGQLRIVKPDGTVVVVRDTSGNAISVSLAETISTVPLNLGSSGNPVEGFYVANYASDIQYAGPSQFASYLGDAIVTQEFGSNSPVSVLHYNGDGADNFTLTQIGTLPLQSEDGIFVTAQRINDIGGGNDVPEPVSMALLGGGLALLGVARRRRG